MQKRRELARRVETPAGEVGPALLLQDAPVDFAQFRKTSIVRPCASSSAHASRTRAD